jgi:hypothetical protein
MVYNKKTSTEVEVNVQNKSMKKERGQGIPTIQRQTTAAVVP